MEGVQQRFFEFKDIQYIIESAVGVGRRLRK